MILQLVVLDKYPLDGVADVELHHEDDTMNLCIHILDPGPGHKADVAELNILAVLNGGTICFSLLALTVRVP